MRFQDQLAAAEYFAQQALPNVQHGAFGDLIRTRLPAVQDQLSFLTMSAQLLLGDIPAFDSVEEYVVADDDEERDKSLPELFRDVYGLERAQTDRILDEQPWLPTNLIPTLIAMAKQGVLSWRKMQRVLRDASAQELEQARAGRQVWFVMFPCVIRALEAIAGDNVLGLGLFRLLDDLMPSNDAAVQAIQVVMALMLRRLAADDAAIGEGVEVVSATIRQQAPLAEHLLKVIAALDSELPDATRMLTCGFQAMRTRAAFERHLAEALAYYQEHPAELEVFWARHPDLYELPNSDGRTQ